MEKHPRPLKRAACSMRLRMALCVAPLLLTGGARGEPLPFTLKPGDEFAISRSYESVQQSSAGSSGNSRGKDALIERVIGVREGGMELEFDLPKATADADRARSWQFPVRVFRPSGGPMQLLNRAELEARIEDWLKKANLTHAACGRWVFTWSAFRIECDPQAAVAAVEAFHLQPEVLSEGTPYQAAGARGPGMWARTATGPDGEVFTVEMALDPGAVHRARAEADVVAAEVLQKPTTLAEALGRREKESVSGTIVVTLATDSRGHAWRRTQVTTTEIRGPAGERETQTDTEIVERHPASERASAR